MRFCPKCGIRMLLGENKYSCPRCKQEISLPTIDAELIADQEVIAPVAVVNSTLQEQRRVHRPCPQCGNPEAFSWVSQIDGEHAGVKQERTLKRFQCTRCFQTWTESL